MMDMGGAMLLLALTFAAEGERGTGRRPRAGAEGERGGAARRPIEGDPPVLMYLCGGSGSGAAPSVFRTRHLIRDTKLNQAGSTRGMSFLRMGNTYAVGTPPARKSVSGAARRVGGVQGERASLSYTMYL